MRMRSIKTDSDALDWGGLNEALPRLIGGRGWRRRNGGRHEHIARRNRIAIGSLGM